MKYMAMNRSLFVMWMAGMLLLSSCSIKEDRSGCPCWMKIEMPDQVGHDNDLVLRLRGNSDEDAVDYEYQMTETVNTEVVLWSMRCREGRSGCRLWILAMRYPVEPGMTKGIL